MSEILNLLVHYTSKAKVFSLLTHTVCTLLSPVLLWHGFPGRLCVALLAASVLYFSFSQYRMLSLSSLPHILLTFWMCLSHGNFSFSCRYVSLSTVSPLRLMRPTPPWWWDRQRVIKVESHLVGKLTSIRAILPRGRSPSLWFPPSIPPTQYIPDSHPPSFILPDLLPHHVSAPYLSSSLSSLLLSFLIFSYPLLLITLNLSSWAALFCDSNLSFLGTLEFVISSCVLETFAEKRRVHFGNTNNTAFLLKIQPAFIWFIKIGNVKWGKYKMRSLQTNSQCTEVSFLQSSVLGVT